MVFKEGSGNGRYFIHGLAHQALVVDGRGGVHGAYSTPFEIGSLNHNQITAHLGPFLNRLFGCW